MSLRCHFSTAVNQFVTIANPALPVMLAAMAVSVTVLASGSSGNCTVVSSSRTRLLVDAGLSCRELLRRMLLCGQDSPAIDAILITHEHTDHIGGLRVLAKRLKVPVYITGATYQAYQKFARDNAGNRVTLDAPRDSSAPAAPSRSATSR